jgi:hypothetical protein
LIHRFPLKLAPVGSVWSINSVADGVRPLETAFDELLARPQRIMMGHMEFEWDLNKATRNLAKHGVSFQEATSPEDRSVIQFQ